MYMHVHAAKQYGNMAHLDAQASESGWRRESVAEIQGRGPPQLRFLICGKTGIGKSSLINFILGEDVCEVGDPGSLNYHGNLKSQTKTVEGHSIDMNGVQMIIYDSPGLQDGTDNDEEYLHGMFTKCRDVNLVFYCHDMPNPRWTDHEINAIRLFTEKFGANFWDKAVFVLTKANLIQPTDLMSEEEEKLHFNRWQDSIVKKFREEVAKQLEARICTTLVEETCTAMRAEAGEIRHRVDSIPAVPTGSRARQVLLNDKHFIGDLWVNCLERIPDPHLSEAFMQATNVKKRLVTYEEIEREGRSFGVSLEAFKGAANTMAEPVHKLIHKLTSSTELPTQPPTLPPSLPTEVTAETKYPIIVNEETKERIKRNIKRKWMLRGAALGGLAGSVVLPVVGTAIGAAVGAGIAHWLWGRLSDL